MSSKNKKPKKFSNSLEKYKDMDGFDDYYFKECKTCHNILTLQNYFYHTTSCNYHTMSLWLIA